MPIRVTHDKVWKYFACWGIQKTPRDKYVRDIQEELEDECYIPGV